MSDYSLESLASKIEFEVVDYILLIELFLDTTNSDLKEISSALLLSDQEIISAHIHNIKGASMNLGLNGISEIMDRMSKLNKAGRFTDIKGIVEECKTELKELRKNLEQK
jgi:HPt (histidine-containing phosphotransfer) domain-containing protein